MSNIELLDRAAGATMCQILQAAGPNLIGSAAWALWNPKLAGVAFSAGALSLLASNYLCDEMPMGGTPSVPNVDGCQKVTGGYGYLQYSIGGETWNGLPPGSEGDRAVEIQDVQTSDRDPSRGYASVVCFKYLGGPDTGWCWTTAWFADKATADSVVYRIVPVQGECEREGDDLPLPPPEATQPISYTDNVTNCTYNVTLQGFAQSSEGGTVQPVFLVEGATQQRAGGGVMGGCNFAPTIYMPSGGSGGGGDDGGGGVYIPVPDGGPPAPGDDGVPWWVPALAGAVGGAVINQVADLIDGAFAPVFEPATFTLTAPCDVDENGDPQYRTWDFAEGNFQQRVNAHQVALMEIMQQHLDWKTPTCSDKDEKPVLEGQWVTTRWESIEKMAHSGRRLRKLFRYRTKSARDVGQLSAYWEAFTWQAGSVRVHHKGAWWGTPAVWAASEEEGQRVIRFAAAEAGIDPDQDGEWGTSSSRSPRYGMSGTMRVARFEGFPWVASRDGEEWPNILAQVPDS